MSDFATIRKSSSGFVKSYSDWVLQNSLCEYDELAVASALAVLATAAQGSYFAHDGQCLSLYQICLLPTAGGKDDYLRSVQDSLRNSLSPQCGDSRWNAGNPASSHGLRAMLFAHNSRLMLKDEVQDWIAKMSKTDNVFVKEQLADIKQLYNGIPAWEGSTTATRTYPEIICPRLSVLGFGTPSGFFSALTPEEISGGFLGRFIVWRPETPSAMKLRRTKLDIDPQHTRILTRLALHGRLIEAEKSRVVEILQLFTKGGELNHLPMVSPKDSLTCSQEAQREISRYWQEQDGRYCADWNDPGASMLRRSIPVVIKVASLHALGCERTEVQVGDVLWAEAIVRATIEKLAVDAKSEVSSSILEKAAKKIVSVLEERGGIGRTELICIMSKCRPRFSSSLVDEALTDLDQGGMIKIIELGQKPVVKKGCRFSSNATITLRR
jgi:hypothetical protein